MLEIRCSESGAEMRMHFCEAGLRRLRRKHSTSSNRFHGVCEKVETAFDNFNGESIFMRRAHTPTIATDGRYLFSKLAFCFDAI